MTEKCKNFTQRATGPPRVSRPYYLQKTTALGFFVEGTSQEGLNGVLNKGVGGVSSSNHVIY